MRASSRNQPAATSSSATLTKTRRPSDSSTLHLDVLVAYPPPWTLRHLNAAKPTAASTSDAGKFLCKLEAVAVGIEDVEQPHRAVKLEDDAELHALASQRFGHRLHVLHVYNCDAPVLQPLT